MNCRPGCGSCCIAPSITRPFLGMPPGKPAGVRCVHLNEELLCALWQRPERPDCCGQFQADPLVCGNEREEALVNLQRLEQQT